MKILKQGSKDSVHGPNPVGLGLESHFGQNFLTFLEPFSEDILGRLGVAIVDLLKHVKSEIPLDRHFWNI